MKKLNLILIPFHDYKKWISEGFRTRDAHLFEHLKKHKAVGKVLVVNRPISVAEMLWKRCNWKTNIGTVIHEEKDWRLVEVENNIYYIDIFIKDFINVVVEKKAWWNTAFNNEKVIKYINKAVDIINMDNRCLILQSPMSTGVIGKLNEDIVAFDAIDNWLHHPQMCNYKDLLEKNYNLIDKKADVIFTVSESLKSLFTYNRNVNWIANGVEIDYFSEAINNMDKNKNKKATIGYVGKIQERVDFDLVEECLKEFNDNEFIFLGPILAEKKRIDKLKAEYKNIKFLGDIHYSDLPKEMKNIDIAIIPHKVNEFTNSMNPLKLYEYLAAGKQVITTEVAGINGISKYVYESKDNEEFIKNIYKAISLCLTVENLGLKVAADINAEHTWKNKCNQIINLLLEKEDTNNYD